MNAIIGFSEIILKKDLSRNELIDYVRNIKDSSYGLLAIINDVLDISKIELASKTSVAFEPFSRQVPSSRDISLEVSEQMMHETILLLMFLCLLI